MRILIIGGGGMLGHKLYQQLGKEFEIFASIRGEFDQIERFGLFELARIIENVDVGDENAVRACLEQVRPDCVINAAGIIKQVDEAKDPIQSLVVNAVFPQRLSQLSTEYGFRLISIGTDCVFDGKKGGYTEADVPDARDLYGLSKLLGEVTGANSLTLRTSIIGRELGSRNSIVEWFLANRGGRVRGFTNAIYSGLSTIVLARVLRSIILDHPSLSGLFHVSSESITKYDLLALLNKHFAAGVEIEPYSEYVIDRSLDSSRFQAETGWQPPTWDEMVAEMAADPTQYGAATLAGARS